MSDFKDVGEFHRRFGLDHAEDGPPRNIDQATFEFRAKFLQEELGEYCLAHAMGDLPGMADALVDLVYVAMGTAHLHGFPWKEIWDEVQRANMSKVRAADHPFKECRQDAGCTDCVEMTKEFGEGRHATPCGRPKNEHSARGSALDVVKPLGWRAPDVAAILRRFGWRKEV